MTQISAFDKLYSDRKVWLATLVPCIVLIAAALYREIWRDDVWALYMSDPELGFSGVIDRSSTNVHPPFYFVILHFWRSVIEGELAAKFLNALFIIGGALATLKLGKNDPARTQLFLLFCAGSYWLIYFAAEIRPYTLMFVFGAIQAVLFARIWETAHQRLSPAILGLWVCVGAALPLTHYFYFVSYGFMSLILGVYYARHFGFRGFVKFGLITSIGIIPGLIFLFYAQSRMGIPTAPQQTFLENIGYGINQFFRGVTTKLFGANLAFAALFVMALPSLIKNGPSAARSLGLAIILTVAVIFLVHIAVIPVIKERSFMVVVPAALFVMVSSLKFTGQQGLSARMSRAMWLFIALSPLLFIGEYTKDRERISELRATIKAANCQSEPIAIYYRFTPEGEGFNAYYVKHMIGDLNLNLVDIAETTAPQNTSCRLKGMAIMLPRGEKYHHENARTALRSAGLDLSQLNERALSGGRHLLFFDEKPD